MAPILGIYASSGSYSPYFVDTYSSATNSQTYQNIGFDSSGNIYCLGYYANPGLILSKYNFKGELQWANKLTTSNSGTYNPSLAVSSGGNCYIACADPATNSRLNLIKVDNTGTLIAQRYYDSSAYDEGPFISLDSSENIWLGFDDTSAGYGYVTAKFDSSFTYQNGQRYTDGNVNFSQGFGLDSSTNYYNTIRTSTAGYIYDLTLAKFNSSFASQWIRRFTLGVNAIATKSFTDSSGNTYTGIGYSASPNYSYLVKYDTSGNLSWQRKISNSATVNVYAVTADSSGNVYLAVSSTLSTYLLKYNSSGTLQWQRSITNFLTQNMSVDSNGYINLVGSYTNSSSINASFLIVYPNDGSKTGTINVGSASFTIATSSLTDSAGTGTGLTPTGYSTGTPPQTVTTPTVWSISTLSDTSTKAFIR